MREGSQKSKKPKSGVEIAGLFDWSRLVRSLGKSNPDVVDEYFDLKNKEKKGLDTWIGRSFRDPRGELVLDTGSPYVGQQLPEIETFEEARKSGANLKDVLSGTAEDVLLGDDLANYRAAVIPNTGGYHAGVMRPKGDQPGLLFVDASQKDKLGELFTHEAQHVTQSIQNKPVGSTTSRAPHQVEQAAEIGQAPYAVTEEALRKTMPPSIWGQIPQVQYYSSFGEAEARAAQDLYNKRKGLLDPDVKPEIENYLQNPGGFNITPDMLWKYYKINDEEFPLWWNKKWAK